MNYTIDKRKEGYDSANLYADGKFIGFVGDKSIALMSCPECGRENLGASVMSGSCAWCGFEIDEEAVKQLKEEV